MGLNMYVEIAGCPTVCRHCWAQGVGYGMMALDDIRWVLEESQKFCRDAGLDFGPYPMHEIAAHPQAPQVMRLFRDLCGADPGFEPLATTGVPLATRDDWRELIAALGAQGTRHFWVAFHGLDAAHDRLVHREGAFRETLLAVERVQSLGFRCGANVFLTREMAAQFEPLREILHGLGLSGTAWEVARYQPTARARQYEAHRPTLGDLSPLADRIARLTVSSQAQWQHLGDYTEAAWVRRAQDGGWEAAGRRLGGGLRAVGAGSAGRSRPSVPPEPGRSYGRGGAVRAAPRQSPKGRRSGHIAARRRVWPALQKQPLPIARPGTGN